MSSEVTQVVLKCAYCKDVIEGEPVIRRNKAYCCEACAFEATRPPACDGRGGPALR